MIHLKITKNTLVAFFLLVICGFVFAESGYSSPFQPLKDLSNWAAQFDFYTKYLVFFFALGIFAIAIMAYLRAKSRKMLLVAGAFFLFTAKWGLKVMDMYFSPGTFLPDSSENVFELGIFILLLIALFKK